MGGGANLRHALEDFHVLGQVAEVVVRHQGTERLAAGGTELVLVHLLEDGALVPSCSLELLEGLGELILADVHYADLEVAVRLCVAHQIIQPAPSTLQLLEVLVVQHEVHLLAELLVQLGNHGLHGGDDVIRDEVGLAEGLLGQGAHGLLYRRLGFLGLGAEFLVEQGVKVAQLDGLGRLGGCGGLLLGHGLLLLLGLIGSVLLRLGREGLEEGRVLQHLADKLFRSGLAVHVGHQGGQLLAGLQ